MALHLRAKELTIFRDSLIWQLAAWALGVGWGSGPLGAATRCPHRRRPFHFFFATWLFLAIRNVRVLGTRRTTTDDGRRNRAPPLKPPCSSNRKSPNFYRQIFFGDFNETKGSLAKLFRSYKSRTVISIGYMSSRFKGKLCMVLLHNKKPSPCNSKL